MTIAFWCVLAAAFLPYLFVSYAKSNPDYLKEGNKSPRTWAQKLEGGKQRAWFAHLNGFEAFPPFAAGVIIAHLAKAPQGTVDGLAIGFIVFRIIHGLLYIVDKSMLRSLVWFGGVGCMVGLFIAAAMGS